VECDTDRCESGYGRRNSDKSCVGKHVCYIVKLEDFQLCSMRICFVKIMTTCAVVLVKPMQAAINSGSTKGGPVGPWSPI